MAHRATPRHVTPCLSVPIRELVDLLGGELAELRAPVAEALPETRDFKKFQNIAAVQEARDELDVYDDVPVIEARPRAHHLGAAHIDGNAEDKILVSPQRREIAGTLVLQQG